MMRRKFEVDKRNRLARREWPESFQDIFEKTQKESIVLMNIPLKTLQLIASAKSKQCIKQLFTCPNCQKRKHPDRLCFHCHDCEAKDCDILHDCQSTSEIIVCPLCFYSSNCH